MIQDKYLNDFNKYFKERIVPIINRDKESNWEIMTKHHNYYYCEVSFNKYFTFDYRYYYVICFSISKGSNLMCNKRIIISTNNISIIKYYLYKYYYLLKSLCTLSLPF